MAIYITVPHGTLARKEHAILAALSACITLATGAIRYAVSTQSEQNIAGNKFRQGNKVIRIGHAPFCNVIATHSPLMPKFD